MPIVGIWALGFLLCVLVCKLESRPVFSAGVLVLGAVLSGLAMGSWP